MKLNLGVVRGVPLDASLWHPGVNFTKILQSRFLYKNVLQSFSLVSARLCNFVAQEYPLPKNKKAKL